MNYVFNPFAPTPVNLKSHVRGWDMHWAECLKAQIALKDSDLTQASVLYWSHGVNFSGGLNLFGGVSEDIVKRIEQIVDHKGLLVSLDVPMPNYADQLRKRLGQATCHHALTSCLIDAFEAKLATSQTLTQASLGSIVVTIGDSHSTAFAPVGSTVLRTNGQTLYGALKDGKIIHQLDSLDVGLERVTLVYGSIDIRHHIGRQHTPLSSIEGLCNQYAKLVRQIKGEYLCDVEVAAPVPVEHEGRKLPQTGYYKGTAFSGSRTQRLGWTMHFIDQMQSHCIAVAQPPMDWYTMDGEEYAKTYMEMGGSVHIAPMFYRRFNWGQL